MMKLRINNKHSEYVSMDVCKNLNEKNRLNENNVFYAQCLLISFDFIRCDFSSGRIHFGYRLPGRNVQCVQR